ncbi:unnamed protein product [Aphanomyces euteiches]
MKSVGSFTFELEKMGRPLKGMAKANKVFTVDDDDYDDGTAASMPLSNEEVSDEEVEQMRPSSLRIRASNFDDLDATYKGKVVKRADLLDEDEDMERAMEEEWSEGEPFAESDDEEGANLDVEEEVDDDEQDDNSVDEANYDDSDVNDSGDDEEGEESNGHSHRRVQNEDDVDDMIRSLEEEDEAILMRSSNDNQQQRAKHVYHQKIIYERCLELQISIKQILNDVNGLSSALSSDTNATVATAIKTSMAAVHAMQQELYTLPEFAKSKKRSFDAMDIWSSISTESDAALAVYGPVLSKHAAQADTKKFKAVNQDVLVQVDGMLADIHRVGRKAHPLKEDSTQDEELDESLYDDKDFYHQLLKEYIESGSSNLEADGAATQLKLKRKVKKVNRKASKGRVIKYTVMPKLQHFMFPNPSACRTDMDVDELFRSLFSSTTTSR